MLELLFLFSAIALAGAVVICFLKVLLAVLILPFKVAFFLARGALFLLICVPLAIIAFNVLSFALPVFLLFVILFPVLLGVALLVLLFKLVF